LADKRIGRQGRSYSQKPSLNATTAEAARFSLSGVAAQLPYGRSAFTRSIEALSHA